MGLISSKAVQSLTAPGPDFCQLRERKVLRYIEFNLCSSKSNAATVIFSAFKCR